MAYAPSSGDISFSQVKSAFNNATSSFSGMRGRKWYKSDFSRSNFVSSGSLSIKSFYGTSGTIPRVDRSAWPASGIFFRNQPITLPKFNSIEIWVYGAGGGGGGANGQNCVQFGYVGNFYTCLNAQVAAGSPGGTGGSTSITIAGTPVTAAGGGGGNQGVAGSNGAGGSSTVASPPGGSGNGAGGYGGLQKFTLNADQDTNAYNYALTYLYDKYFNPTYGAGGSGGAGGGSYVQGGSGNTGTAGGITVFIDYGLY